MAGQTVGIENDSDLPLVAADEVGLGDLGVLLQVGLDDGRDAAQLVAIVPLAIEGDGEDGHIIDGPELDEGLARPLRDKVEVGVHLVVGSNDGLFLRGIHEEPNDGHGAAGHGGRVYVLDVGYLPQELLHGGRDPLLDLLGAGPWHLDEDVDHRNDDLGLLLSRREERAEGAEGDRRDDDDRRQP